MRWLQAQDTNNDGLLDLVVANGFISGDRHGINAGIGSDITVFNGDDFGTMNGGTMCYPRIFYAMAEDRLFFMDALRARFPHQDAS